MPRRRNTLRRKIKVNSKQRKLKKSFIKLSANKSHCWIAYCEYGKINITSAEKMLRLTVCKKGGKYVQHLTMKFDKFNNFRVYYSNEKGIRDMAYHFAREGNSTISYMLNSITCVRTNKEALILVEEEYEKRYREIFCSDFPMRETKYNPFGNSISRLIYPMNSGIRPIRAKPPVCFRRSIRSHDPKEFTKKFFGRAPKSLTKAVIRHLPFTEESINNLFLAKTFYGIWPIDKVVEFLNITASQYKTHKTTKSIYNNGYGINREVKGILKINIWRNFFRNFTYEKVLNWQAKYFYRFGEYAVDTIFQYEKIKAAGTKVIFSKKMDLKEIHDIMSKIYNKLDRREIALPVYNVMYLLNGMKIDKYDIVFPKTSHDLVDWGTEMHMCVGSYDSRVKQGNSSIFSLQENGIPKYCIEYRPSDGQRKFEPNQFRGKYNENVPEEIQDKCKKTVQSVLKKDKMKVKLIYPEGHKVKNITTNIDLNALEVVKKLTPEPRAPRVWPRPRVEPVAQPVVPYYNRRDDFDEEDEF